MSLPINIFTGNWQEGHIQGIAVDQKRGFLYCSFTTVLLKMDLEGNLLGTVENLVGHLGCIAFDEERNRIYGSLELKHDVIGREISCRTGISLAEEDAFYLVSFDGEKIDRMGLDAEKDGVMRAVYLREVVRDYMETDEASGKPHRYGCSGIDGISLGPVFGAEADGEKKIMICYGVYSDVEREDNDHQVLLQLDPTVVDAFGLPLEQRRPHHSGPERSENRYFFFTGNTRYGVQNLEYDAFSRNWFLAVYPGEKANYENFRMFSIDGTAAPQTAVLRGRGEERGLMLTSAKIGASPENGQPCGSHFRRGSTGMASLGEGLFYISYSGKLEEGKIRFSNIKLCRFDPKHEEWFYQVPETEKF